MVLPTELQGSDYNEEVVCKMITISTTTLVFPVDYFDRVFR